LFGLLLPGIGTTPLDSMAQQSIVVRDSIGINAGRTSKRAIARLQALLKIPVLPELLGRKGFFQWMETKTFLSNFRKGVFNPERFTDEAVYEYLRPVTEGVRQRKRFFRFFAAGSPRYTMQAVHGLKRFEKPTMVIWPGDDRYISPSWGRRLYEDIPGATRFELVPFCGHFWPEERPAEFAAVIGEFLAEHVAERGEACTPTASS